jgi:hypothetical protein
MGIRDRPISARSPWQDGLAERLIGSIRRDCLDHVVIFGEQHLIAFEVGNSKSRRTALMERNGGESRTRLRYFCSSQHTVI